MNRYRNRVRLPTIFLVWVSLTPPVAADGPTSQQLQKTLAAGSNGGVGTFTSLTAGSVRGDLSSATVLPAGSTTSRTLADEFNDQTSVKNFGAFGDGQHDDSGAFQAAEEAARYSASGGKAIFVNPGDYLINASIYSISSNSWIIPAGASLTGPGVLSGSTDNDALRGNTALSLLKLSTEIGNANTLFVSNVVGASNSTAGYQKNGIYARISQGDTSTATTNHDAVSIFADGDLTQGTANGRVWAIDATVLMPSGSDGYGVGLEVGLNNNTGTTGSFGQPNSKFGLNVFASGTSNSTAAMDIQGAGAKWLDGVLVFQSALVNDAFALRNASMQDIAAIHQDGSGSFSQISSAGSITAGGPVQLASYATSLLPTDCKPGQEAFASNGRNPGEAAGNGSGTPVFCNAHSVWYSIATGASVTN